MSDPEELLDRYQDDLQSIYAELCEEGSYDVVMVLDSSGNINWIDRTEFHDSLPAELDPSQLKDFTSKPVSPGGFWLVIVSGDSVGIVRMVITVASEGGVA